MTDPKNTTSDSDLSDLLDSALNDFGNLESTSITKEIERNNVQGLIAGLPSPPGRKRGKQKISGTQNNTQTRPSSSLSGGHAAETLEKLAQQTRQSLLGLESAVSHGKDEDDGTGEKMMETLLKKFEELGGSQDMQSVVDTMMHQLLSKEILYDPMKEIGDKYPQWLESRKNSLSEEDYARYSHQHELIKELCIVYESQPDNFEKIVELMQKMQDCGHPPPDIVKEIAPGFDMENQGIPAISELLGGSSAASNCAVM